MLHTGVASLSGTHTFLPVILLNRKGLMNNVLPHPNRYRYINNILIPTAVCEIGKFIVFEECLYECIHGLFRFSAALTKRYGEPYQPTFMYSAKQLNALQDADNLLSLECDGVAAMVLANNTELNHSSFEVNKFLIAKISCNCVKGRLYYIYVSASLC